MLFYFNSRHVPLHPVGLTISDFRHSAVHRTFASARHIVHTMSQLLRGKVVWLSPQDFQERILPKLPVEQMPHQTTIAEMSRELKQMVDSNDERDDEVLAAGFVRTSVHYLYGNLYSG